MLNFMIRRCAEGDLELIWAIIKLKKYWIIPERQIETPVVLADANWWGLRKT